MNKEDFSRYQDLIVTAATELGLKVLAAVAFWVIGRWLIGVAVGMVRASLEKQKVDPTVLRYVGSIVTVTLNVLLVSAMGRRGRVKTQWRKRSTKRVNRRRGKRRLMSPCKARIIAIAHPLDETTGRFFLDMEMTRPAEEVREQIAGLVLAFIKKSEIRAEKSVIRKK